MNRRYWKYLKVGTGKISRTVDRERKLFQRKLSVTSLLTLVEGDVGFLRFVWTNSQFVWGWFEGIWWSKETSRSSHESLFGQKWRKSTSPFKHHDVTVIPHKIDHTGLNICVHMLFAWEMMFVLISDAPQPFAIVDVPYQLAQNRIPNDISFSWGATNAARGP